MQLVCIYLCLCMYKHACPFIYKIYKKFKFEKESRVHNKSKETINQFELVINSYVAIMHQPVTVSSNM